jgi:formamidopyrimidine-DNA glycosylase
LKRAANVPELPEVETVVRDLVPLLVGRCLADVRVGRKALRRRWSRAWSDRLAGCTVLVVHRRGKWIVIYLDGGDRLVVHLGMTGQLVVVPAAKPADPHTHVRFTLDDGREELRFRDIRRFGSITLYSTPEADAFFASQLGPEPFALTPALWGAQLARTCRCLKAVLLDQRVVAGVGNIYADESLFEARLHPARPANTLTPQETRRLAKAIPKVLNQAIARRGSSISDYVGGSGLKGEYQDELRVYGRTGQPCPRCKAPIERIRLAGRSTHCCPRCQKEDEPQRHRGTEKR